MSNMIGKWSSEMKKGLLIFILFMEYHNMNAQNTDANIFGDVESNGKHVPFVNVYVEGTTIGTTTDETGHFMLLNLPIGNYKITAQMLGYEKQTFDVSLEKGKTIEVNFDIKEKYMHLDEIVVTGTKTFKRNTESPVIINVLDAKTIQAVQANTLSDGLNFQPGLRVETDCQTCNYSQLRMNGLGGSYSQILINSRPVFSPLTGLYGLEQIPSNMIDKIEVVRGGGSSLYGSSAIGGTVNVITKPPKTDSYEISLNNSLINGKAMDNLFNGNLSVLSKKRNAGVSFFASRRNREVYDHNDDNFSELPKLKSNSFGFTSFMKPNQNHKIELSFSSLYEYRYGGEITDLPAHFALQSEERTHNIIMGGLDYEINFKNNYTSLVTYFAGQNTERKHYTGIIPDTISMNNGVAVVDLTEFNKHFMNPPYGNSYNSTYQVGIQLNHQLVNFPAGVNTFTLGGEYILDDIEDEIVAYNYFIDQSSENSGMFIQSDWEILGKLTLLSGARIDFHNYIDQPIVNPRVSMLYQSTKNTQIRASWATGFRAPQAFDADMHIAFAGGGISRVILDPNLKEENSNSFTASFNYDKPTEKYIWGGTIEGFYTLLENAFVLEEAGEDDFGTIFEKRNGSQSIVQGATVEIRYNYNRKIQVEAGFTLQSSQYADAVQYSADLPAMKEYLKTPEDYGFYTIFYTPKRKWSASLSGVYTGSMKVLHAAGAPELIEKDEIINSDSFLDKTLKLNYYIDLKRMDTRLELYGGVKNILNAYQKSFDTAKNRDSNFIYGPSMPRSVFFGLKLKSLS